jgi:hypothetical protein
MLLLLLNYCLKTIKTVLFCFQDDDHHRGQQHHVNAKLYIDGKEVDGFFPLPSGDRSMDKAKFIFTNGRSVDVPDMNVDDDDIFLEGDEDGDGQIDEPEVFLVAERPSAAQRRSSWLHRRLSSESRKKKRQLHFSSTDASGANVAFPEVTILSVNSFCRHEQPESEDESANYELFNPNRHRTFSKCKRRQFSIPNLMNNATAAREVSRRYRQNSFNASHLEIAGGSLASHLEIAQIPRSRLVSLVADRLQQRPVYAPCHPIDLEGLQETAV